MSVYVHLYVYMCVRIYICMYVCFYYKELAHEIREVVKSPNVQGEWGSWRPKRVDG